MLTQKSTNINIFLYTNTTQDAQIDIQVHNTNINAFALFGLNNNEQIIKSSTINVTIHFQVLQGALLCITCNVLIYDSSFVFVGAGQQISGLIIEPETLVEIIQSFVQVRSRSNSSSGLVNVVNKILTNFTIIDCKLVGSALLQSGYNGYLVSNVQVTFSLVVSGFKVCVDQMERFGNQSVAINEFGTDSAQCDLCGNRSVAYGLCVDELQYSHLQNETLKCVYPFVFIEEKCKCADGFLLNNGTCLDLAGAVTNLTNVINNNLQSGSQIQQNLADNITQLDQRILSNASNISSTVAQLSSSLEQYIISNFTLADQNLLFNTTVLNNSIQSVVTSLLSNLQQNTSNLEQFIVSNYSLLNSKLQQNVSYLENRVVSNFSNLYTQLDVNLYSIQQYILQQYNQIINNIIISKNNIENSITDHKVVFLTNQNTSITNLINNFTQNIYVSNLNTIQVFAQIKNIFDENTSTLTENNIVQFANLNTLLSQINTTIQQQINYIISLQIQLNCTRQCGHQMVNSVCTLVNCSISGQIIINQTCQCANTNAFVNGSSCVCPTFSTLLGTVCTCPANSVLIGTVCVCNLISGQIMNGGVCQCSTLAAIIYNNACTCGVNGVNSSNVCSCPTNSTMVGHTCTCTVNEGQIIQSGACVCQTTNSFVSAFACTCGVNGLNTSNTCSCPTGAILQNGTCVCTKINAYISGSSCVCPTYSTLVGIVCTCPANSVLNGIQCVCNAQDKIIVNNSCQCPASSYLPVYIETNKIIENIIYTCNQYIQIAQFDIVAITHQVSGINNFSSGYVFSTSVYIQDSFIDIQNSVFSINYLPIFQNQNCFSNIKIQIGTQQGERGSLLTPSLTISISQIQIISKLGCDLIVNNSFSIISQQSKYSNINNLLINLTFAMSQGNITLINSLNGTLNLTGYQVFGTYQSSQTIALIGIFIQQLSLQTSNATFQPDVYNTGNCSSFYLSRVINSSISFSNISIFLGDTSQSVIANQIDSDAYHFYRFGGLMNQGDGTIYITNIIMNGYLIFISPYNQYSGILVGAAGGQITISNMCFQQSIATETTIELETLGIISMNQQNLTFQQSIIELTILGNPIMNSFGIMGYSNNGILINLKIKMTVTASKGDFMGIVTGHQSQGSTQFINIKIQDSLFHVGNQIGGFVGYSNNEIFIISNSTLNNSSIRAKSCFVAGFVGYNSGNNITITNSIVFQTNISAPQEVAGFISILSGSTLILINSSLIQVRINGYFDIGAVVSRNSASTFNISGTSYIKLYMYDQPKNCENITNNYSVLQCT
ncbi:Conserved_hypothetical protein [Hexamita inflata]|uniref:Uncharacterized protein n=1 Tax=Hexamita inflata TaxID=28002 RepID=A0AA86Q7B6_9EUKA|nr:Conserved hypothetical protein [Hexamita inflata]